MLTRTLFADAGKSAFEPLSGVTGPVLQGAQQLAALNVQATQAALAEFTQLTQAILAAKSPAELGQLQIAALQAAPRKALAYASHVKEIVAAATAGQRSAAEAQVATAQAKLLETVQGALKNAPGSENTLALVKSAVAAANNAYDGVNKLSKQVSTVIEANATTITSAVNTASDAEATTAA
jgi:phasin family protein